MSPERISAALGVQPAPSLSVVCSLLLFYMSSDPKLLNASGTEASFLHQLLVLSKPQTMGTDVLTDEEKHPKIKRRQNVQESNAAGWLYYE